MKSVKSANNTKVTSSSSKQNNKSKINNFGILSKEDKVTTIYIGNMMFSKDEFEIKRLFAKYGKVTYIRLVRDSKTLKSKGYAFVQMPNELDAKRAIDKLNGMILDDRTLKVSIAADDGKAKKVSVKSESGHNIGANAPKVLTRSKAENDIEARSSKRRRARTGLDLLFKNTKKANKSK